MNIDVKKDTRYNIHWHKNFMVRGEYFMEKTIDIDIKNKDDEAAAAEDSAADIDEIKTEDISETAEIVQSEADDGGIADNADGEDIVTENGAGNSEDDVAENGADAAADNAAENDAAETDQEEAENDDPEPDTDNSGDDFAPDVVQDADIADSVPEKKPFPIKKFLTISGIIVGAIAVIYLAGVAFYSSHFFFNTNIGNFDCSNLTVEAAADRIKTDINDYTFTLIRRDETMESISGKDIALAYEAMGNLEDIKKQQNPFLWAFDYNCRNLSVDIEISYDEAALYQKLAALDCIAASNAAMVGATANVYYDSDSMTYKVHESGSPDIISLNKLVEKTKTGISGLYKNMYLEHEGCYVDMADEDKMRQALDTLNRYVSTKVTYLRGDETSYLDGGSIHEWLTLNDDYTVTLDTEGVRSWVGDLAGIYGTIGSARTFVTTPGESVTVSGGDYGWQVDKSTETDELIELIKAGGEFSREPVYRQTAGSHGPNNDLSNTYVEISLNAQHVWFYKDGELIVSTDCVTGDPTKNNQTPTGIYYIKYKERNATLKGEDYETPVDYWMPFNGGIGLHDLTSRGAFGGSIYRGNGSHGCVNLPHSAAQKIYENIERGVAVVVY